MRWRLIVDSNWFATNEKCFQRSYVQRQTKLLRMLWNNYQKKKRSTKRIYEQKTNKKRAAVTMYGNSVNTTHIVNANKRNEAMVGILSTPICVVSHFRIGWMICMLSSHWKQRKNTYVYYTEQREKQVTRAVIMSM